MKLDFRELIKILKLSPSLKPSNACNLKCILRDSQEIIGVQKNPLDVLFEKMGLFLVEDNSINSLFNINDYIFVCIFVNGLE
jgi:hypothetical protein